MTRDIALRVVGIATLILAAAIFLVARVVEEPNPGFTDAAAALTFIAGAAVAIERIIEIIWTILGNVLGSYWPLTTITNQVKSMVDDLNAAVTPFYEAAERELDRLEQAGQLTGIRLEAARNELARMKQRFDELVALTPDNQRVQLLAAAASQNVTYIYNRVEESSKQLEDALDTATATINGLQEFLASFKDNPGRRLISLYMGAVFGLAVAGIFSLDIFQAVLDTPPAELDGALLDLRVIFTGLVIGLGSNPTHEVIRLIQEYKENRKGANVARPKLP